MPKKSKPAISLKRFYLFILCLVFFLLPGQSYYSTLQTFWQPVKVRQFEGNLNLTDYPVNYFGYKVPQLTANSVLVLDADSAATIYAKNENVWFLPASTVKMMTALVTLDHYQLDEILIVGQVSDFGQDMQLLPGEKISVKNLLYGLLVSSANDAALVLAQNFPGGKESFMAQMNQKASQLYLKNSYFANPTGLDIDDAEKPLTDFSYTTALDLARLSVWVLKNETFRQMVATPAITVTDVSGKIRHPLANINILLTSLPGVQGIKTGWTDQAGECLVTLVEREKRRVVIVVLGSQDRFGETAKLVEWVFANYRWENITPPI